MVHVYDHGDEQSISVDIRADKITVQTDIWQYDNGGLHVGLTFRTANLDDIRNLVAAMQEGLKKMEANRAEPVLR